MRRKKSVNIIHIAFAHLEENTDPKDKKICELNKIKDFMLIKISSSNLLSDHRRPLHSFCMAVWPLIYVCRMEIEIQASVGCFGFNGPLRQQASVQETNIFLQENRPVWPRVPTASLVKDCGEKLYRHLYKRLTYFCKKIDQFGQEFPQLLLLKTVERNCIAPSKIS